MLNISPDSSDYFSQISLLRPANKLWIKINRLGNLVKISVMVNRVVLYSCFILLFVLFLTKKPENIQMIFSHQ